MPESNELFSEIASLRDQVDDLSRSVSAIARTTGLIEEILAAIEKDPLLGDVFLLVDGKRTQKDIVDSLAATGKGSQSTVSRKLESLIEDWELVRPTSRSSNGVRLVQTSLAKDLKIARSLAKRRTTGKKSSNYGP